MTAIAKPDSVMPLVQSLQKMQLPNPVGHLHLSIEAMIDVATGLDDAIRDCHHDAERGKLRAAAEFISGMTAKANEILRERHKATERG